MDPDTLKSIILKLIAYCQKEDWRGYDPYDALNSPILKYIPFLDSKWPRIALTQFMKRCPFNFRPLLGIQKTENPKAIALFLMSFIKLRELGLLEDDALINLMAQKLIHLRSPDNLITRHKKSATFNSNNQTNSKNSTSLINQINSTNSYWCWGYSFPWQTRNILVPNRSPNLVCTTFVANSLLDMYEFSGDSKYLYIAKSAGEYILNELYWEGNNTIASFSYPLIGLKTIVHNGNFLGSALLSRLFVLTKEETFLNKALKVAKYSASKQNRDGSWYYGEHPNLHWIDNFHTGYNLVSLYRFSKYSGRRLFEENIKRGFLFYKKNFFENGNLPKYYYNMLYPIDIHSIAQSIITLIELQEFDKNNVDLAFSICEWAIKNMKNKQGFFYYQKKRFWINKISYMRWSQGWMLLGLSTFLESQQRKIHCILGLKE